VANDAPPSSESGGPNTPAKIRSSPVDDRAPGAAAPISTSQTSVGVEPASVERVVLDDARIRRALVRIAHEIVESNADVPSLYVVAIPNGGVPLGRVLVQNIAEISDLAVPLGILDTTLYRDDLALRGTRPRLRKTEMPSSVDDHVVVLVEDVVNTGRTIRAAMDALMDFGRPRAVQVVALVDRGHRELPIKIDYVGKNIPTRPGETVVFRGPEDGTSPLEAVVQDRSGQGRAGGEGDAGSEGRR
jgi:pyrimidine operon attenuation protein/uracil phosphoribosyltransferase